VRGDCPGELGEVVGESPSPRSGVSTPSSGGALEIVLTEIGGVEPSCRKGPSKSFSPALWIDHDRVGPRRARASELAPVDALDRDGQMRIIPRKTVDCRAARRMTKKLESPKPMMQHR
jgi:hypothetical protein